MDGQSLRHPTKISLFPGICKQGTLTIGKIFAQSQSTYIRVPKFTVS